MANYFLIDYLDSVMVIIKKLAPPQGIHYWIQVIVDDIVSGDGRQIAGALRENASFQPHNVILR